MPSGLPCPNPTCPHVFPPAAVAGATSLTCPRCGKVFYFRAGPAPAPPPQAFRPAAAPMAPPAPARPAAPAYPPPPTAAQPAWPAAPPRAAPVATPVQAYAAPPDASPPADLFDLSSAAAGPAGTKRRYRNRGFLNMALVLVAMCGVVGLGVFGMLQVSKWLTHANQMPQGQKHISDEFKYSYIWPDKDWELDNTFKLKVGANLMAMTRLSPHAWMALASREYRTRTPRDAEVIDEGLQRLRQYFGTDSLEYNVTPGELGKQPCQRLVFKAQDPTSNVRMIGECYALGFKGFAYWFYIWCPEEDIAQMREEFAAMNQRFELTERPWTDYRPPPKDYPGESGGFKVTDTEAMWELQSARDFDPLGDLALVARDPARIKDLPKGLGGFDAEFLVLKLRPEAGTKPEQVARNYVEEGAKKLFEKTIVDVITDRDKPGLVGEVTGHVTELHISQGSDRSRYIILAVVEAGGTVWCLKGECDWNRRDLFETDFKRLIGTFRIIR